VNGTTTRHLIWANGDGDTCGGLSYAKLDSDMVTILANTTQTLTVNGLSVLGTNCGGGIRPYLEGASLYKWTTFVQGNSGDAWTIVFAAKPTSVPNECTSANAGSGNAGTANEVIAYATATTANGPYTYRGIIMCGSASTNGDGGEWTNQASIMTLASGKKVIVYHDGPGNQVRQRKRHAECLFIGGTGGRIAGVYRQALDATYGFNNCTTGSNAGFAGLRAVDSQQPNWPPMISTLNGNGDLKAHRYAVGPWERFKFEVVDSANNVYVIRSLSNNKLVCRSSTTGLFAPTCDTSVTAARFKRNNVAGSGSNGRFTLQSMVNNLYLSINSNGRFVADGADVSQGASFYQLGYGGS
jgi:hypothetical protein